MKNEKEKKKMTSRILSALVIFIGVVLVFAGYWAMQQLLERRQERLLSQSGESKTVSDEDENLDDEEQTKLTAEELEDILIRETFSVKINPHEPYGRQMTMQEAIETGQTWIEDFCAKYGFPSADGTISYEGISAALYTGQLDQDLLDDIINETQDTDADSTDSVSSDELVTGADATNAEAADTTNAEAVDTTDGAAAGTTDATDTIDAAGATDASGTTEAADTTDAASATDAAGAGTTDAAGATDTEASAETDSDGTGAGTDTETDASSTTDADTDVQIENVDGSPSESDIQTGTGVELSENSGNELAESMYGYWDLTFSGKDIDINMKINAVTGQVLSVSMDCDSYTTSVKNLTGTDIVREYFQSFGLEETENVFYSESDTASATDALEDNYYVDYDGKLLFIMETYAYGSEELGYPADSTYTRSGFSMYVSVNT